MLAQVYTGRADWQVSCACLCSHFHTSVLYLSWTERCGWGSTGPQLHGRCWQVLAAACRAQAPGLLLSRLCSAGRGAHRALGRLQLQQLSSGSWPAGMTAQPLAPGPEGHLAHTGMSEHNLAYLLAPGAW